MKTIKIIDLLIKRANEEDLPEKIKYRDQIYYLSEFHQDYVTDLSEYIIDKNTYFIKDLVGMNDLNEEVEIIEEVNIYECASFVKDLRIENDELVVTLWLSQKEKLAKKDIRFSELQEVDIKKEGK